MEILTNVPLRNYLTMKLGGNARFMTEVTTPDELAAACRNANAQNIPFFILGGGSNVLAHDDGFNGFIIQNKIKGIDIVADDSLSTTIKIGAGENWDDIVARSVEMNLSGIEAMSAIPGTAGAAPVQNVGAYGQEIADTLLHLDAYDTETDSYVTLQNEECGFSYRNSIFRGEAYGRYAIFSITLKLLKKLPEPPFYAALQRYFDEHSITTYTPSAIRKAVTAIRTNKLPDPSLLPNTGSFFKNAIIEEWQLRDLRQSWPDIPSYELPNKQFKVPTGWLIENSGLKGSLLHGMRIHDKNCLVLINESATSFADLSAAREEIIAAVRDKFRIIIEQEPLELVVPKGHAL